MKAVVIEKMGDRQSVVLRDFSEQDLMPGNVAVRASLPGGVLQVISIARSCVN